MPQSVDRILGDSNFQAMDIEERRKVLLSVDAERFGSMDRGEQDKVLSFRPRSTQPSAAPVTSQQRQLMSGLTGGADATISARPTTLGGRIATAAEEMFPVFNRLDESIQNFLGGVKPDPVLTGVAAGKRTPVGQTPIVDLGRMAERIPGPDQIRKPSVVIDPLAEEALAMSQGVKPIASGLLNTAGSFTTPENAAILATSGGAGRLPAIGKALSAAGGAGFDAMMVSQAIQSAPELMESLKGGDVEGAIQAGVEMLAAGAMGAHGGKGKVDALRRQPGMTSRPLEGQNARLAVEDALPLTPEQLEMRNRELLQQGSPAVADVHQAVHEAALQGGAYGDLGRKAVRRKAGELREEMPRSAEMLDTLAEQKRQPAGREGRPSNTEELGPEEIRRAGRVPVSVPEEGLSIEEQQMAARMEGLAEGYGKKFEELTKEEQQDVHDLASRGFENPETTRAKVREREAEQELTAARQAIAESLGLDLAKASPEDLAAVDQLAKEGWTGQSPQRDILQEIPLSEPHTGKEKQSKSPQSAPTGELLESISPMRSNEGIPTPPPQAEGKSDLSVEPSPKPTAREPKTLPKGQAAVEELLKVKSGEIPAAFEHPEVGKIDLVYGDAKSGLAKIAKRHPEVVGRLDEIIRGAEVISRNENSIVLEDSAHAALIRLNYFGKEKKWLLTAYEKKGGPSTKRTIDVSDAHAAERQAPRQGDREFRIAELKSDIKEQLGDERGSFRERRVQKASLAQNLTELAGIYLREGVEKFSEFLKQVREAFGKVPSGAAAAWNAAKKLNQDIGRGNAERGSVKFEGGKPEEEAKIRASASGSGGRGGRVTEAAAAAGAEADPRGTGGEPVSNPDKLGGERDRIITSPNLKNSRESYIKKLGLDDSTIKQVEAGLSEWEKENPERRVMTFDDVRKEAMKYDPTLLKDMDRSKAQEAVILDPGMRQAAKNTVNAISREQVSLRQRLSKETLVGEERAKLQRKAEQLEHDFRQLTDILIPTRSQIGRTLAFERIMAEQSFDVTYWLDRAKKAQAIPDEVKLPEAQIEKITEITKRGADAEAAAVDRVQGGGKSKTSAEIEKQARAELGPEPVTPAPATPPKSREARARLAANPIAKPDPTLVEKQARYKAQLQEKMKRLAEAKPIEKKASKWELTPEQRRQVEQDPEVQAAARELARTLRDLHKDGWWKFLQSLRKADLLTAPATHLANTTSNAAFQAFNEASRPLGMVADFAIRRSSKSSGERTVQGVNFKAIREASIEGATKGWEEAKTIMKTGEVPNDGTKLYDFSKELNARHLFENRPILKHLAWTNDAINLVFRSLKAEDRFFKRAAFRRSLEEQMAVAKVKVPSEEMMIQAWADADFLTFNNENLAAKGVSIGTGWLRTKGPAGKAGAELIDFFLPFRNTPANVWMRGFEGMGGGLLTGPLKLFTNEGKLTIPQQRAIAMEMGRGATGLGIVMLGFMAYKGGWATGIFGGDEKGERALSKTAGRPEGAIKWGDHWISITRLSPLANMFNMGATLARQYENPEDFFSNPDEAAAIFTATVKDQPMLRGTQDLVEAVQNRNNRTGSIAGSAAGSMVPSIVNAIGQATDDVQRDTAGGNMAERMGKAVMGRTPGLRQMLPERLDAVGRTVPQDKLGTLLGFPITKADDRPALQEMARVGVSMDNQKPKKGESAKLFEIRQRVARAKGELAPEKLPDEAREVFRARVEGTGEAILNRVEKLMQKKDYQSATDEEKQLQIEALVKKTRTQSSRFTKLDSWSQTPIEQRKEWLIRRLR